MAVSRSCYRCRRVRVKPTRLRLAFRKLPPDAKCIALRLIRLALLPACRRVIRVEFLARAGFELLRRAACNGSCRGWFSRGHLGGGRHGWGYDWGGTGSFVALPSLFIRTSQTALGVPVVLLEAGESGGAAVG